MAKVVKRKIYTGKYLAAAHHLVRELVEIKKYDAGLDPPQQFYKDANITNKAQHTIDRAEALMDAYIFKDGHTEPPIPAE